MNTTKSLFAALGVVAPMLAIAKPAEKPNVIFIMVDDYGWKDTGYNGSEFYETPNIDRLAKQGVIFTDGYAPAPISSPTRVSVMTGKAPARTHVTDWIPGYQHKLGPAKMSQYKMRVPKFTLDMPLEEVTIAEALKEGGYNTYHIGKWHCCINEQFYPQYQGYDHNIGGWHSGSPTGTKWTKGGDGAYMTPYHNPYLTDGPKGENLTDRLGSEAVNVIKNSDDDPFYIYLGFHAVHTPIEPKKEMVEYFENKAKKMGIDKLPVYDEDTDLYQYQPRIWNSWKYRVVQNNAYYAALIYTMDQNVGRVLDALEESGKADNTIVCLLGDNGGLSTAEGSPTSNAPLKGGKGWLYEGGVRVPFLISYPAEVKGGVENSTPVIGMDFYPTILDLCNLPLKEEQHMDGISIKPLLQGKKLKRKDIYFHYPHYGGKGDAPASSIRNGDYKLIQFYEDGHVELYNLKEDLSETTNIADKHPRLVSKLQARLNKWLEECDAQMPTVNAGYKPVK